MTQRVRLLPHHTFARAILIRGTVIWIAVRLAMLMGSGSGGGDRDTMWAGLISSGVVVLVTALVRLDLARLNERLFLANLGVRTAVLTALAAIPPLVLEVALAAFIASGMEAKIGQR